MNKPASLVSAVFLALVAVAQLTRAIFQVEIIAAGNLVIPVWASYAAFGFTGFLAIWLWRERRGA